jgi:replicative DNA helicase
MRLEKTILSNLINNEEFTRKVIPYLKEEYFHDLTEKTVFNLITDHVKKYNTLPSREILAINLDNEENVGEDLYKSSLDFLEALTSSEKDLQWLLDKTEEFCQDKAVYNAVMDSIQILDGRDEKLSKTAIPDILSKALGVSFDSHIGHDWIEDFEERFDFYHKVESRIPFDLEYLNTITKGGLPNKTLTCLLAGTNVGKSLAMCHMAAANILDGKNVLYITMEMAEERIAERIDANLLDVPIKDIENLSKEVFEKKIHRVQKKTNGKLIVKEYPTATAGAGHFRHLLNELKLKRNFTPHIIYIDYLNICCSMRLKYGSNVNTYMYIKSVAEELRGLAVERDIPIVTATQTNRSGYCLDLNTVVTTKNRGNIKIKDVKLGDLLKTNNDNYNSITKIFDVQEKITYKITTKSGKEIICSEEHLFPTNGNQKEKSILTGLKVGDKLWIDDNAI